MKHPVRIGDRVFESKKKALAYYKTILNRYDFGEKLNGPDFEEVFLLIKTHQTGKEKIGDGINYIRIAKLKYNTKCFELVRDDGKQFRKI